jgi:hypothetical protein
MSTTRNLHLVFSTPPASISEDMYNAWYNFHVYEILRTRGYEAARRYVLTLHNGTREPASKRFVTVYQIGGDLPQVEKELAAERVNMDLPRWFDGIQFASWLCELRPGYGVPELADRLYFVFSSEPTGVSWQRYDEWYQQHLAENTAVPGFDDGWRFRTWGTKLPDRPNPMTHLGLYRLADSMQALRPGLQAGRASGSIHFPEWFSQIDFTSVEGCAIGDRVAAS